MDTKEQNTLSLNEKVVITQLTRDSANDLMRHRYFISACERGDVLSHGLIYRMLKAVRLIPRSTRLVAYHTKKKTAIGFLYLEENTDWLYTIEYVFVDPKYRNLGLATKLLNYAIILAKKKGAKKINLNVSASSTRAIDLYKKLDFREICYTSLVQGYLAGSSRSKLIRRVILGQGFLTKLSYGKKNRLFEISTNSRQNREMIFDIYKRCMNKEWIDFFEINDMNLINGSRHMWQPPFFRDVLTNYLVNSFALIFNRPFSSKATVELYSTSISVMSSMLEDLLKILAKRGISFTQIMLFNSIDKELHKFFREKDMRIFNFLSMGRCL